MGLLDVVCDMLSIHNLLIILLFLFIVYTYYLYNKLESKINNIFPQMIDMINVIRQDQIINDSNKKIYLEPEPEINENESKFNKNSLTSLIEVSDEESDERSETTDENDYGSSSDESFDDEDEDEYDDNVKKVHLSLDLDKIEDINVLLIDEVKENAIDEIDIKENANDENDIKENAIEEIEIDLEPEDIKENSNESEQIAETESETVVKRKRESRKNNSDGDYKKMHLPELKKYVIDKNIYLDPSKLKKPELLKLIEEYNNKTSVDLNFDNELNL